MYGATTEAQLQGAVVALLQLHGWKVQTIRQSAHMGKRGKVVSLVTSPGWPDVVAVERPHVRKSRIVAWELKVQDPKRGVVAPEQAEWLRFWVAAGAYARVVRPSDWDEIEAWVRGGR
jgi:hypothetical protein